MTRKLGKTLVRKVCLVRIKIRINLGTKYSRPDVDEHKVISISFALLFKRLKNIDYY